MMNKIINIIYEELGVFMLMFSLLMVPFLVITGACILAHLLLQWPL
jgi:hypothetical protein